MNQPSASGLDGVVVAETALSDVDGERGRLLIRGYPVEELVELATFEDVCGLMWNGALPSSAEREALRAAAGARARGSLRAPANSWATRSARRTAMEALRTAAGHVPASGDHREGALRLTGALAVFAAAVGARACGPAAGAAPPQPSLSHAADSLQMLSGVTPEPSRVAALDAYLCCVVDHGMNASTFCGAGRRVHRKIGSGQPRSWRRSARSRVRCTAAAPGTGARHAGRHWRSGRARSWLEAEIAAGRRIMGMGHRMYRGARPAGGGARAGGRQSSSARTW